MSSNNSDNIELEKLKLKKEIWAKAVDTQMHFNEMSVKSRQLGLTFVVAALGLAAVLISRGQGHGIELSGYFVHIGSIIVLIGAIAISAVGTLDILVYHKMLRGAVSFGEKLENDLKAGGLIGEYCGMTQSISNSSRYKKQNPDTLEGESKEGKAANKIFGFYMIAVIVLLSISFSLFVAFKDVAIDKFKVESNQASQTEAIGENGPSKNQLQTVEPSQPEATTDTKPSESQEQKSKPTNANVK